MAEPDTPKTVSVVLISGSCCIPGMAPLDDHAHRVIATAIAETGVDARFDVLPATTAILGGAPRAAIARIVASLEETGTIGLPAVLVDGEPVSFGVPDLASIKQALVVAATKPLLKEAG